MSDSSVAHVLTLDVSLSLELPAGVCVSGKWLIARAVGDVGDVAAAANVYPENLSLSVRVMS
jgi:hypothetical protein